MQLRDVGLWTAQMVLIFALGRENVWSHNDAGLMRAAKKLYIIQGVDDFISPGERFNLHRSNASSVSMVLNFSIIEFSNEEITAWPP
jgi:DNA-3-methyladenine glycosylase II